MPLLVECFTIADALIIRKFPIDRTSTQGAQSICFFGARLSVMSLLGTHEMVPTERPPIVDGGISALLHPLQPLLQCQKKLGNFTTIYYSRSVIQHNSPNRPMPVMIRSQIDLRLNIDSSTRSGAQSIILIDLSEGHFSLDGSVRCEIPLFDLSQGFMTVGWKILTLASVSVGLYHLESFT